MLTVEDVARRADVSVRTAYRVIGGNARSADSRARVEAAMAELGFVPHQRRPVHTFVCGVGGCDSRGPSRICGMHRERMRRTGTYDAPPQLTIDQALWVQVGKSDGCWPWLGPISKQGYGVFTYANQRRYAHRFVYESRVGPIPDGMQLDHACHTRDPSCVEGPECPHRRCCNPGHLEPVTGPVNIERSVQRRLACRRGHPWVVSNIYIRPDTGHRVCRACTRLRARPWIPTWLRRKVYGRDGNRCVQCGRPDQLSIDHYPVPWSKGGADVLNNLRTLCLPCNWARGARGCINGDKTA